MMRIAILALALSLSGLAAKAFDLGRDLPKDVLAAQGPNCVHGFMVNWTDTFFFAGDAGAFNKFVEGYSKRDDLKRRVVIHVGTKKARSPWDEADRDIPVDWSYHVWNVTPNPRNPAPSHVDVWLGSRIKLDELRIPANIEVVSGGEIDKFISERPKLNNAVPMMPVAQPADDAKKKTPRTGTVVGAVTARGKDFIEVKADGEEKARRYVPHFPGKPEGTEKATLELIPKIAIGTRVRLEWLFEERPRVMKVEVLKEGSEKKKDG